MDRQELHDIISEYFSNKKHLVLQVFPFSYQEIKAKSEKLKGKLIPVKFNDVMLKREINSLGLKEIHFYNALLDLIIEKYKTREEIVKEIEEWKRGSIVRFV